MKQLRAFECLSVHSVWTGCKIVLSERRQIVCAFAPYILVLYQVWPILVDGRELCKFIQFPWG